MLQTVFFRISFCWLIIFFIGCSGGKLKVSLPYYDTPDFTPVFPASQQAADTALKHCIASFRFNNQYGNMITEKTVEGKVHVANFIFTRCGSICPVMMRHMKMVQDSFLQASDLVILSYSVTPWIDSVPRLRKYAEQNGIVSPGWHLLTGSKNEIYTLARKSYFAEEDMGFTSDSTEFLHTEHVLLVDRRKRIRGIYNGTLQLETEQLIKDIRILLSE